MAATFCAIKLNRPLPQPATSAVRPAGLGRRRAPLPSWQAAPLTLPPRRRRDDRGWHREEQTPMRSEFSQTVHPWTGANPFQQVRARYPRRLNDPWSFLASRGPAGEGLRGTLDRLRALPGARTVAGHGRGPWRPRTRRGRFGRVSTPATGSKSCPHPVRIPSCPHQSCGEAGPGRREVAPPCAREPNGKDPGRRPSTRTLNKPETN
jgi:hypothetical protein